MKLARDLATPSVLRIFVLCGACAALAPSSASIADSFQGVGDLPGNAYSSLARDATLDGNTVVGDSLADEPNIPDDYEGEAFVWERNTGILPLGYLPTIPGSTFNVSSVAYAISSEGSVAVGDSRYEIAAGYGEHEAVRWLNHSPRHLPSSGGPSAVVGPPLPLGFLSGGTRSAAFGVSKNGAVIVGFSRMLVGSSDVQRAFVWTDPDAGGNGMQLLDPGDAGTGAVGASTVSDDGSLIVGYVPSSPAATTYRAAYWEKGPAGYALSLLPDPPQTAEGTFACSVSGDGRFIAGNRIAAGGIVQPCRWERVRRAPAISSAKPGEKWRSELLGVLKYDAWSTVLLPSRAVSFDGAVVVGISGTDTTETAFVWDAQHKMRKLADVLTLAGITAHQTWDLAEAWSVSGDASHGYTIVGGGTNPANEWEGFVVHLDAKWF